MQELLLTDEIVDRVKVEAIDLVKDIMGVNLVQVIYMDRVPEEILQMIQILI